MSKRNWNFSLSITSFSSDIDLGTVTGGPTGKYPTRLMILGNASAVFVFRGFHQSAADSTLSFVTVNLPLDLIDLRIKEIDASTNVARVTAFWEDIPGDHPLNS